MQVRVIVNPGAGQPEPVLSILNDALGAAGIDWDVAITHAAGDGFRETRRAVAEAVDMVCSYGGDGTVAEVASALAGGRTPMAILPGGTGNALADDLGIPADTAAAAALLASGDYDLRPVDMGRVGERFFVVRATMGFEASVVEAATRELKDRFGWLAYAFGGLRTLADPPRATYSIEVDGEEHEVEGLACIVANSAASGVLGLKLSDKVDVSDGLLDVMIAEATDLAALAGSAADAVAGTEPRTFTRWRGERVRVQSEPAQALLLDGEAAGNTPVEVVVVPGAVRVVVPRSSHARE